jgi:hypothetical protein
MLSPTLENNIREEVKKILGLPVKKKSKDDFPLPKRYCLN